MLGGFGYTLARRGRKEEANEILKELRELRQEADRTQKFYVSPYHLAVIYTGLGDNAQALDWLERGFAERTFWLAHLKVEPAFDGLRKEPGFQALLKKMNFPP